MSRLKAKWLAGAVVPILVLTDLGAAVSARAATPAGAIVVAQSEELSPEELRLRRKQERERRRAEQQQQDGGGEAAPERPRKPKPDDAGRPARNSDAGPTEEAPARPRKPKPQEDARPDAAAEEAPARPRKPKPDDAGRPARNDAGSTEEAPARPDRKRPKPDDAARPADGGAAEEAPARPRKPKPDDARPADDAATGDDAAPARPDRKRPNPEDAGRPARNDAAPAEDDTPARPDRIKPRPDADADRPAATDDGDGSALTERERRQKLREELRNRRTNGDDADRPGENRRNDDRRPGAGDADRPRRDDNRRPGDEDAGRPDRGPAEIGEIREERQRREVNGREVIIEPGGRTIIRRGDRTVIRYNELDRLEDFGDVRRERRGDLDVTIVERRNGVRIITYTDADGHVVRRVRRTADGRESVLFVNRPDRRDDYDVDVVVALPPPVVSIPREQYVVEAEDASPEILYDTFAAPPVAPVERRYSLEQVVNSPTVLERVRRIDLDTITFDTGSWTVAESQINSLDGIAKAINDLLAKNPNEVFLIEGHTDAVGSDIDNLSLSDRRAEEVAYLLTEYYQVPPENLTTKGYGEGQLKVDTDGPARENRRVTMRRITPLLETSDAGQQ